MEFDIGKKLTITGSGSPGSTTTADLESFRM